MLDPNGRVAIPGMMIPSFRTQFAIERKAETNLILKTWGGLGDQICAEPTLRFALRTFKGARVSLASEHPELFRHLPFAEVYDIRKEQPDWSRFFEFNTIVPPTNLLWEFVSHMVTNCVDFPSICAFRCQLPVAEREVILKPESPSFIFDESPKDVFIHAGRHWPSKTFPKDWWDSVIQGLISRGLRPILIGADTDDNRGTVDVDTNGVVDLRNKLSINDSIYYLQRTRVLLTNDSSPLHMAVTGGAWIGFIATCKHPDYISHWRRGVWSWRMENLGLGGIWDVLDYCPNRENSINVDNVEEALLRSWLPEPDSVAAWAKSKAEESAV